MQQSRLVKPQLRRIRRRFYLQPTLQVARQLIGKFLVKKLNDEILIGRIVETEAYLGEKDPASHAYNGMTRRNEVMFGKGGHLYVYFTYGMHFCCNVVTEEAGIGHAVLLRAVEPVQGFGTMARRRHIRPESETAKRDVCNGPAKLCEAFGIGQEENGVDLCAGSVWLAEERSQKRPVAVVRTTRIGITQGTQHKWRFHMKDNPYVSKGRPM
ncbi:MAG: DNA-3-methyladenine glycosylase [Bacteroidetes bacterium]|nr:DNA-3-methyladenine glycosylase [Bacteroidota bacterium]MCW5895073.1 DNA-3-methyladenine glycosylase [Bacteroidota bacterium]